MSYAFISHQSACEALRASGINFPTWLPEPRFLPTHGDCIARQRTFVKEILRDDLDRLGIVTDPVDILVPTTGMRRKGKRARMHGWRGMLPADCFLRMGGSILVSRPEFVLLQLANTYVRKEPAYDRAIDRYICDRDTLAEIGIDAEAQVEDVYAWEKEAALVRVAQIAMELMGTYRLPSKPDDSTRYECPALTDPGRTMGFMASLPISNGFKHTGALARLRRLLPWVMTGSASPMETALALMLTLPSEQGGYGLPQPELNGLVDRSDPDSLKPDLFWRSARLVVEYDSSEFHAWSGADKIDADIERANALRAIGITVLEVTPGIALDERRLGTLAMQVARLLDVSLPPVDHTLTFRREQLHQLLFFS